MSRGSPFVYLALVLSALVGSPVTAAEKRVLLLGGAGDPEGPGTIFDRFLATSSEKFKSGNYESSVAFDGGHADTERIVRDAFGTSAQTFTTENGKRLINQFGKLVSREKDLRQVLVIVDSHGISAEGKVHQVVTHDGPRTSPTDDADDLHLDLDELKIIQKSAQARGIKIAIIDLSCFSGRSLALAEAFPGTCVITGSNAQTVSYCRFAESFAEEMKPGRSLEDTFLAARSASGLGWPQISSPAGRSTASVLDSVHRLVSGELSDRRTTDDSGRGLVHCLRDALDQISIFRQIIHRSSGKLLDQSMLRNLASKIETYFSVRRDILGTLGKENERHTLPNGLVVSGALLANLDAFIKANRRRLDDEGIRELKEKRDQLKNTDSAFAEMVLMNSTAQTRLKRAADHVGRAERDTFARLYERESHVESARGNPCRDFKF